MAASHHGPNDDAMKKFIDQLAGQGAREYSQGRAGGDDEGDTAMMIAVDPRYKIIKIIFPKPMDWVGLGLPEAEALLDMLNEKTKELRELTIASKGTS